MANLRELASILGYKSRDSEAKLERRFVRIIVDPERYPRDKAGREKREKVHYAYKVLKSRARKMVRRRKIAPGLITWLKAPSSIALANTGKVGIYSLDNDINIKYSIISADEVPQPQSEIPPSQVQQPQEQDQPQSQASSSQPPSPARNRRHRLALADRSRIPVKSSPIASVLGPAPVHVPNTRPLDFQQPAQGLYSPLPFALTTPGQKTGPRMDTNWHKWEKRIRGLVRPRLDVARERRRLERLRLEQEMLRKMDEERIEREERRRKERKKKRS
ncbi:hypothetical protein QBC44DRAFT_383590 [Cladorrhinum sp. PSN332]|nr:hypothetical protein QBC44DRAFT_383590 [Cladorrhinum sp. PSN332]